MTTRAKDFGGRGRRSPRPRMTAAALVLALVAAALVLAAAAPAAQAGHKTTGLVRGVVLHLGDAALPFGDRLEAAPLSSLWMAAV